MATLAEIRAKYGMDGGKYQPNPSCKFCAGKGERHVAKLGKDTFCICLFVAPDFSDEAGDMMGKFAKQQLEK